MHPGGCPVCSVCNQPFGFHVKMQKSVSRFKQFVHSASFAFRSIVRHHINAMSGLGFCAERYGAIQNILGPRDLLCFWHVLILPTSTYFAHLSHLVRFSNYGPLPQGPRVVFGP